MEKFKNFLNSLKEKHWAMILLSIFSVAVIAFTLVLVCLGQTESILSFIMYPISALALTFLIYCMVVYLPIVKDAIIKSLKKHKFTNELLDSYGYRSIIFASCSFVINIAYAVVNVVVAVMSKSIWFGALATYYIALSLIRGILIASCRKRKKKNKQFTLEKQLVAYRNTGVLLMVLNVALVAAIVQMVMSNQGFEYAGLMIYVIAVYTFYKLGLSIYNLFKMKKHEDYLVKAIKSISFADALVSVLALQTAMFAAFAQSGDWALPNALTGGAVSMIIIGMGIFMIVKGQIGLKQFKKEPKIENVNLLHSTTNDETEKRPKI